MTGIPAIDYRPLSEAKELIGDFYKSVHSPDVHEAEDRMKVKWHITQDTIEIIRSLDNLFLLGLEDRPDRKDRGG